MGKYDRGRCTAEAPSMTARERLQMYAEDGAMIPGKLALQLAESIDRDAGPMILSTVQAARQLGFSPRWWAEKCAADEIPGAWQEEGYWRMPRESAHALILRKSNHRKGVRRGPSKK